MPANVRHLARATATAVIVGFVLLMHSAPAGAHEGPPYPILMDKKIPGYLVSVWADPDVGTGTFYIITKPTSPATEATPPRVETWVEPVDGRLERVTYPARRQTEQDRLQFVAEPQFDRVGNWSVGFLIHGPDDQTSELVTEVKVTPPGYGPWSVLIYLVPFLLFGGMWALALLRRWRSGSREDVDGSSGALMPEEDRHRQER